MINDEIRNTLFSMRDEAYRAFQIRLIPTVAPERVIGVRTPALRQYAKRLLKTDSIDAFLDATPHKYFDENQLHAFIISEIRDFELCSARVEAFLPYVDNWATCDQLSPGAFKKHRTELIRLIKVWIKSPHVYTVRFALGMLMANFLDEGFEPEYNAIAAGVVSDEYYIQMMVAWYFATALAKRYEETVPYISERRLDPRVHDKAIQKALESRRISPERKQYLRSLK